MAIFLQNQLLLSRNRGIFDQKWSLFNQNQTLFIKNGVLTQNFWYFFLETNVFFRYQTNDFLKYWNQIKTTEKLKKTTKNRRIFEDIWRKIVRNGLIGSHKNSFCLHFWCFWPFMVKIGDFGLFVSRLIGSSGQLWLFSTLKYFSF